MERIDCNKNHLRYKLTQYLSHLICKSRQCILINISCVPFKLKLNLQLEQGEQSAQWYVWGSWGAHGSGETGDAELVQQGSDAHSPAHQAGHLSTHQHQPRGTELHSPPQSQEEKHSLQAHVEQRQIWHSPCWQAGKQQEDFSGDRTFYKLRNISLIANQCMCSVE